MRLNEPPTTRARVSTARVLATPETALARQLGVALAPSGWIQVDTEQKTSIPGGVDAGDVTNLHSHQVTAAVQEGAQAASAANYFLYPPELKAD